VKQARVSEPGFVVAVLALVHGGSDVFNHVWRSNVVEYDRGICAVSHAFSRRYASATINSRFS